MHLDLRAIASKDYLSHYLAVPESVSDVFVPQFPCLYYLLLRNFVRITKIIVLIVI